MYFWDSSIYQHVVNLEIYSKKVQKGRTDQFKITSQMSVDLVLYNLYKEKEEQWST